ncbi:exodeoxyribonuclease VII small subunit [uncultured Methanobrevibacter sp.]|uniref:exodeoxyribonuclease VII small subunit n=1 Tax=uncultured Methanobrevibacter sp. TaxID=253161 RepID=UPI0026DFC8C3|nr:exodeoxyribonuclease VII small subunit [uncultured Methanobrevibacter sp.]
MENATFEESLSQLEEIVEKLENGDVSLDSAIEEFDKAMKLIKSCDEKLNNAEKSIAKIVEENNDIIDFNIEE